MPSKLGQNFLVDESVLEFEADSAGVKGKSVLEIGAGDGRLTRKLLSAGAAHVTAVEIDHKLARLLRIAFRTRVKVAEGDFLDFPESRRFNCIVGNIPYYATSPILLKLARMNFDSALLCLQKEVAERILAEPGTSSYGRLSVFCQLAFRPEMLALVERSAFSPSPKVDSCIISLRKTGLSLSERQDRIIGALFSHRRKSVRNAVVDGRMEIFGSSDKHRAQSTAQTLKYAGRKVFTLSPGEALETADRLV
jgi:16S rRNA (adenine1518-N6/adenine1519-N6)-dimethyltransferase